MVSTAPTTPYSTSTTTATSLQDVVRPDLPIMVHVTAPATLPAGYTFEAEINGDPTKLFTCEVPEGGVQEGQIFLAPLSKNYDGPRIAAPTGRWKDGLFNCFNEGLCHPSLCCPLFCGPISMGQIMSRMQLTWLGEPGPLDRTRQTFFVVVLLVLASFLYGISLDIAASTYPRDAQPQLLWYLRLVGILVIVTWQVYALCRTRQSVRERYQIPEEHCAGCEDICCSVWCSCCATSQMLRHTGEYENYPGVCCSATGHPPGTPLVV